MARQTIVKNLPQVPKVIKDPAVRDYLSAVKSVLDVYAGINTNSDLDKVVRFSDLVSVMSDGTAITLKHTPEIIKNIIQVSGNIVRTGRIESGDGLTYFDLDAAALVFHGLTSFFGDMPGIFIGKDNGDYKLIIGHRNSNKFFAYDGNHLQMVASDDDGNVLFDIDTGDEAKTFLQNYADQHAIEHELMKMNYQYVSWAQFAVFDIFQDDSLRASPDPSTYDAVIRKSRLYNGADETAGKAFGFVSKTYTNITTIETGTSTSVGLNFLTDTAKAWYADEAKNLTLVDSAAASFNVDSNDNDTLTVAGTPTAGVYSLIDDDPSYAIAFMSYLDTTNGGYGHIKYEVSFNGGTNYQTFYDSESAVDILSGTVDVVVPGNDYIVRITLKNDAAGKGPEVYNFLVCTDPSPWRY